MVRSEVCGFSSVLGIIAVTVILSTVVNSSRADPPPTEPSFPNTEPATSGSPMDPAAAAAAMTLPDGFSATVFASEPDVQNPIAMAWDGRGRMWVAENYTYADRSQRFDLSLRDRVVIFDGTDQDSFSTRTIFTDDVQMLTGIEVVPDGVYLMCPPRLLFVPDENHDDVPDGPAQTILDGFTVAQSNYHNFANGIRFGPDGWLYGRCGGSCPGRIGVPGTSSEHRVALEGGIWRYHPVRKTVEVLTTGTTNPWGHDFDSNGQMFFVNTVNGHLWHMIAGAHFTRPFTSDPNRLTYDLIDFHADHWHFDTTGAWHESRDGVANSYGGGHAHSGCLIYNDDAWPAEYRGKLWTLNFHGRRINQERLVRRGTGYVAMHDPDFATMADPWFRGIDLSSGPDGSVFILDWSDAGECHEHDGVHRTSGRIYKIKHRDALERSPRDVASFNLTELISATDGSNQWLGHVAAKQLSRKNVDVGISPADLAAIENEYERASAIERITQHWPIDDALGHRWKSNNINAQVRRESSPWIESLVGLAKSDASAMVRLTLASTLQRLLVEHRSDLAAALVSRSEDIGDHNQPKMIWYGMIPLLETPGDLLAVAEACRLPETLRLITRGLAEQVDSSPQIVDRLLAIKFENETLRQAVLEGLHLGFRGRQQLSMPNQWASFRTQFPADDPTVGSLDVLFGDGRAVDELIAIASGKVPVDDAARAAALENLIAADVDGIKALCLSLLKNAKLNLIAAKGLAKFDDAEIGRVLAARYRNFRSPQQPALISILVSRRSFASALLSAIESGELDRSTLTAFDVRQIHSLGDDALSATVSKVWGEVRDAPEAAAKQIESLKQAMTASRLAAANKSAGRVHFNALCKNCHQLYGEGEKIGPDLTGGGRSNLDYVLTNILAPSAVVDKDYRLSVVMTDDGRVINGLVVDESPHALRIQTATEILTVPLETIERRHMTDQSPMPSGLLTTLSDDQIAELIAYLQHPTQVPLPPQ